MRLLFGSMFMAAGLFFFLFAWRNRRSMRRSVPAVGTVEDIVPGETTVVKIRYRDAAGREHLGTTQPGGSVSLRVADPVTLRYDPERPDWVMIEGRRVPYVLMLGMGAAAMILGGMILATGIRVLLQS